MPKRDLRQVIAQNLRYFMRRPDCQHRTPNALALAAGLAPNTVYNFLDPKRRTVTTRKPEGFPTLDKLEALAAKLPKCETWMLLHPDIQRALREIELYAGIERDYAARTAEPGHTPTRRKEPVN